MLEAILVESMMWVVGGTVLGILGLLIGGVLGRPRVTFTSTIQSIRRATSGTSLRASNSWTRRNVSAGANYANSHSGATRPSLATSQGGGLTSQAEKTVGPVKASGVQACPSCGLVAPSELMEEHFLGSPLHRNPRKQVSVDEDDEFGGKRVAEVDPVITGLLRSLMRLLVPPRAFGLRGQERTVDPLRGIIKRSAILENIPLRLGPFP